MMRIIIADDHSIVRVGLRHVLNTEFPSVQIDEAQDAETLLQKIFKEEYKVVITDLSMPGRSGLDALEQIKAYNPKLPVLVLSAHPEDQVAIRVLKAGASGFLNKDAPSEELIKAVHALLLGKKYITPSIADKLLFAMDRDNDRPLHELLSSREFEVMKLLAGGKSVSDIAEKMSLSITTVSTYRSRILEKMNIKSNAQITIYAIENKLI